MRSAVFFERDGILNFYDATRRPGQSPMRVENFRVNEAVRPQLEALRKAGLAVLVATNQPAVGAGAMSRNEVEMMHTILRSKLPVDDILMCPHDDATHPSFKPHPGLFMEAAFKWTLDLDRSFVISDKWQDAKAAQIAGCTSVMVASPWVGSDHHDFVVPTLEAAIQKVLHLHAMHGSYAACA